MYEFMQTATGWQIYWGPPQILAEIVKDGKTTEEAQGAADLKEVIVRRRMINRRPERHVASRRRDALAMR